MFQASRTSVKNKGIGSYIIFEHATIITGEQTVLKLSAFNTCFRANVIEIEIAMHWLETPYLSHSIVPNFIKPNQRGLQQKLAELRQERGEHELVAEILKKAEPERKAWRLVGKRRLYRTYIYNLISFHILKYLFVIILFQVVFLRNELLEKYSPHFNPKLKILPR